MRLKRIYRGNVARERIALSAYIYILAFECIGADVVADTTLNQQLSGVCQSASG